MFKHFLTLTLTALLSAPLAMSAQAADGAAGGGNPRVRIDTNLGEIIIELDPAKAPVTVENFLGYVRKDGYKDTIFHRVIPGFMAQGGGFGEDYKKKAVGKPIKIEADNGLRNDRGTIAMARTGIPDSATRQFFINLADNDFLNHTAPTDRGWGYTVFGHVTSGMEVVDAMAKAPTGAGGQFRSDVPKTPIVIKQITLVDATKAQPTETP